MRSFAAAILSICIAEEAAGSAAGIDVHRRGAPNAAFVTTSMSVARESHTATLLSSGKVLLVGGSDGSQALPTAEIYDPRSGVISPAGSLAFARYAHTATVLTSGEVLIVGGHDGDSNVTAAEIYDPDSNRFSTVDSPPIPRSGHTATRLATGNVLIAGGFNGSYPTAVELYDAELGTFTVITSLLSGRQHHTASLLPDGNVLVTGGQNATGVLDSSELFTISNGQFVGTGALGVRRSLHSATVLTNGNVLIAGGTNGSSDLSTAEIYATSTGAFSATGTIGSARSEHSATLLPNGTVFVIGGRTSATAVYNPADGTFSSGGNVNLFRKGHTATLLASGQIVIAGGEDQIVEAPTDMVELFDWNGGMISFSGSLPSPRGGHTATVLLSGKVLIAGGFANAALASAAVYDPATGLFTDTEPMTIARSSHTATLLSNGMVLIAGGSEASAALNSAEIFDPASNSFRPTGALEHGRASHTATLLPNGRVLVAGGTGSQSSAELYDPITETFTPTGSLVTGRRYHTATLTPAGLVVVHGGQHSSGTIAKPETYDPFTGLFTAVNNLLTPRVGHTTTLLPSGKLLIAGGESAVTVKLSSAELFDPQSGTVTATGSLAVARDGHTATLLVSGKVLLVGGTGAWQSAEVYDPATGRFSPAPSFTDDRSSHSSTLLPSGKVLVAGGGIGPFAVSTTEVYDEGLGSDVAWRPALSNITLAPNRVDLSGSRFAGLHGNGPEASGGGTQSSATNHPLVQMRRIDNEEMVFMPVTAWDGTSFSSGSRWSVNPGPVAFTVITSAIAGTATHANVTCGLTIAAQPSNQLIPIGSSATFEVDAIGAFAYQWQTDVTGTGSWTDIPGAIGSRYITPPAVGADSGTAFRVVAKGNCRWETSAPATLTIDDPNAPTAAVVSPSGGEYWLLATADQPRSHLITWTMSDDVRICRTRIALLFSDDGGEHFEETPLSDSLPASFGSGGSCLSPGNTTTNYQVTMPLEFPAGQGGLLYKVKLEVTDQAGNTTTTTSQNPFYIVQANPDSVQTLILHNTARMIARQGITSTQAALLVGKLHELAEHPRVQGVVVDLDAVTTINNLYSSWDDAPADATKANNVLFGPGGIHEHLRASLLAAYTGVKYVILVGDDRIIPMARLTDGGALLTEATYASTGEMTAATTVGAALTEGLYLSDDPLAVRDAIQVEQLDGALFLPDLNLGRLVETSSEIITAIATYISQDGVLDLSQLDAATGHKVLVTGYDFLTSAARQISERWKNAFGISTPDSSSAPVDGSLIGGDWGYSSVPERQNALRARMAGNGGARYGVMSISGHATHYEEGVPGTDPLQIDGLSTADIYGPDACVPPTTSQGALNLAGSVVYAVGCHGGLPVPGSCRSDVDHSLDLPQTMFARGVVAYVANTGYGWGLKSGIGYSARMVQIFTEELTAGGTLAIGEVVRKTKQRYFLETPRYDAYDEKTIMQWALFGFPMYAVKSGVAAGESASLSANDLNHGDQQVGAVRVRRETVTSAAPRTRAPLSVSTTALPANLTQLALSFDFTAPGVYEKFNADGESLPLTPGCPDPNGCYYTLNGTFDRGTGSGDLPIQPYLIFDSRLSGTSQHGVLWRGGTYDEEPGWIPVIAELVSNGGDGSDHGSTPRQIMLRPTAPRVIPGLDPPGCRANDSELNSITLTSGEAVKNETGDFNWSIERRYRNIDLEVFYYNNRSSPAENCDRSGPALGAGPFDGQLHTVTASTISWTVPASDSAGVWRVLIVYNRNTVDGQGRGTWVPVELTHDGSGTFRGSAVITNTTRLTYVVQAVDNRGNVTWLDYVSTRLPSSGVDLGIPKPVDVLMTAPSNVTATATSATSVTVSWNGVAAAVAYDVYRTSSAGAYEKIGSTGTLTFADNSAASGVSYLYAVKAIDGSSNASPFSNHDLATTMIFVDPTLTPGGTIVKAVHLSQIRSAVNAVRLLAGLDPFPFTDSNLASGATAVKATHVLEARSALAAARTLLALSPVSYTGSAVVNGARIEAVHIRDLRSGLE